MYRSVHIAEQFAENVHTAEQLPGVFTQQSSLHEECSHSRAVYRSVHTAERFTGVFPQLTGVFIQQSSLGECSYSRVVYRSVHTAE